MKPGTVLNTAFWLDGRETPEILARFEADMREALAALGSQSGMLIGPLTMVEKRPGTDRVPPVPDHIQGPDVRLIVAEATVLCRNPMTESHFVDELERDDLMRLRKITRRVTGNISDADCDDIINELGPESALDALRAETLH